MVAVDTNIIVRLITGDDSKQLLKATRLVESEGIWVGKTVTLETAWVLKHIYDASLNTIVDSLRELSETEGVYFESEERLEAALNLAENGVEIADAMHLAFSKDSSSTFHTFDKLFQRKASQMGHDIKLIS